MLLNLKMECRHGVVGRELQAVIYDMGGPLCSRDGK